MGYTITLSGKEQIDLLDRVAHMIDVGNDAEAVVFALLLAAETCGNRYSSYGYLKDQAREMVAITPAPVAPNPQPVMTLTLNTASGNLEWANPDGSISPFNKAVTRQSLKRLSLRQPARRPRLNKSF